jgi:single-strand DNA-binding protein
MANQENRKMSYSNINRVVLVGRLTTDPELRALPSGTSVCSLRVACNTIRKSGGEYVQKANFFGVSVYGGIAETVHRYMVKGRRVAIDGHLEWREWEAEDGSKRQTVEIVAERVEFLEGRGGGGSRSGGDDGDAPEQESEDGFLGGEVLGATDERELVGVGAGIEDDVVF